MNLKKNAYIETHENVTIEYETANLGSRYLAKLLDDIIFYGAIILTIIILTFSLYDSDLYTAEPEINSNYDIFMAFAIFIAIIFVLRYFYFVIFDMILKGQSPGKKAARIRVVSVTGEPITFLSSLIRNLFRIVDGLPALYLFGSLFVIFNKKSQRLGDIVANTMVIKTTKDIKFSKKLTTLLEDEEAKEINMQDLLDKYLGESEPVAINNENLNNGNILGATISKDEYELLSEYLAQRDNLPDTNIMDIKLFNYYFRRVGAQIPDRMYYSYVIQFLHGVERYNRQFFIPQYIN